MAETWRVGHAAARLDVPRGTELGGYVARSGPATGVLDPLEVGAVAFADPAGTVAVVCVADLLQVDLDLAVTCRRAVAAAVGTDLGLVWLTATHTHGGPSPGALDGMVEEAVVAAAVAAVGAAVPARVSHHRGTLVGVGGLRSGPPRDSVPVDALVVRAPDGSLLGLLGVVPVHPTVLPAGNLRVSADLPGAVRRALAARSPGVWSLVATGAAGDVSTRPHRREQTPAELGRLGGLVAEALVEAASMPARGAAIGPVSGRVDTVALAPADPAAPFRTGAVEAARSALAAARAAGDERSIRDATVRLQGAELGPGLVDGRPVGCAIAALDLGGVRLLGLGGEPFLALADAAAEQADEPGALLVGYANGYCGYLPTRAAFEAAEGRPDYEVLIARVAPGEPERALAAARLEGSPA